MKLKSLLVLLLAGIWGVGSWWWYTCKIKGFCGADVKTTQVAGAAATGAATLAAGAGTSLNSTTGDDATKDSDNDGIPDAKEIELGLNPNNEDTDGDGISDAIEVAQQPQDTDGDGKINAFDNDDDGDGVLTADENPDPNSDGNVDDAADANGNKIADYLEKGVATPATVQTAGAGSAGAVTGLNNATGADKAAADKAAAEQKAETDKAAAAQKAEADKLAADQAAAAQKAEADKLAADQAAATQKAEADKLAAEQKAKEESDKVTIETTTAQNGDIGPATLHFPTGSANPQLAGETKAYFEKVAQFLKDNATAKVTIVGHTDNKGDPAKNKALGLKRAEMLQKMLLDSGAPKDRVNAASEGPNKPIADNATEEGRKKNRRVEITPVK